MPVLDASVCVAIFNEIDPDHPAASSWFAAASLAEEPIVAPVILLAEVGSALARALDEDRAPMEAVKLLRSGRLLELFPVDGRLAARAATIGIALRIRGADAIYVALADQLGIPLITFDRQQLERGGQVVTARTPASSHR
jgi:predicted nucleic acid-binding protein